MNGSFGDGSASVLYVLLEARSRMSGTVAGPGRFWPDFFGTEQVEKQHSHQLAHGQLPTQPGRLTAERAILRGVIR